MKKHTEFSCIVLACDSNRGKGNSVFHCLLSIFQQTFFDFEIILVENSHYKVPLAALCKKMRQWNTQRAVPVSWKIVNNTKSLNRWAIRNKAVKIARGNTLIFLEDDTILSGSDIFDKLYKISQDAEYGYGAERLWTRLKWFSKHTKQVLHEMEAGVYHRFLKHAKEPSAFIRGESRIDLQKKTFIANFGFCRRTIFDKLGGFPDFSDYGFEDDYLMFRLFASGYRFKLLNELKVVHISYRVNIKCRNPALYFQKLVESGYFWFHVGWMFSQRPKHHDEILEPLRTIHFDERVERAYQKYCHLLPLDLRVAAPSEQRSWRSHQRLSRLDFARLLMKLQHALNIDAFVKNSSADFDSLASLIEIAIAFGVITVSHHGRIKRGFNFHFTFHGDRNYKRTSSFFPKSVLNQFPCDEMSRRRRYRLFKNRYPFVEFLRFAIIGEDDLITQEFVRDYWAWPVVIEKDPRITQRVRSYSDRYVVYEIDVRKIIQNPPDIQVETFITDPPYTFHGALAFIIAGLKMLALDGEPKECYVILNPAMLGVYGERLIALLAHAGVILVERHNNFSHYVLPRGYSERVRAHTFLKHHNVKPDVLKYSSSSDLFVFRTRNPDIQLLKGHLKPALLYKHYL